MINLVYILYTLPFFFFLLFLFFNFSEKQIRTLINLILFPPFVANFFVLYQFLNQPNNFISIDLATLHLGKHHHFGFSIFVDSLSLIVLFLTSYLSLLVAKLSHTYLHRETGYQRFYRTIFLFISGMFLISLAGNLDMFFAGWELVGFSSFLLIAFYRDRTRPVKNAYRIYSIYRFADTGLLLGAIAGHVITHNADHFEVLALGQSILSDVSNPGWLTLMGIFVLISAVGKSGQFPFINWPARAMEGPTPSSAIFYGALSIHCGVILLLRTYEIWKSSSHVIWLICLIGLLSFVFATLIGRIQSNIKGQIAYATVAQIGLMFIEVALGFHKLVLFHIVTHSLLRCYQLLISPSVVVEGVKTLNQDLSKKSSLSIESFLPEKLKISIYNFAFQEGFLSISERGFFIFPFFKWKLFFRKIINSNIIPLIIILGGVLPLTILSSYKLNQIFAYVFASLDVLISAQCLLSLRHPKYIWRKFLFAQFAFLISIYLVNPESLTGVWLYCITIIPCWLMGYWALKDFETPNMKIYNGYFVIAPHKAHVMFLAFIGFSGLPLTTVFWAEDILLGEIFLLEPVILILTTLSLMFNGLIVARILSKTFWGFPSYVKF